MIQKAKDVDYQLDLVNRYERGEFLHADSIQFEDSLQYKTAQGRIVYGGGGIMPDYFVPIDTTQYNTCIEQLLGKYILQQYALEYANKHKEALMQLTYEHYLKQFTITDAMLAPINERAKLAGICQDMHAWKSAQKQIRKLLKAYIAKNTWREQGFYPIINQDDKLFLQAIQLFDQAESLLQQEASNK